MDFSARTPRTQMLGDLVASARKHEAVRSDLSIIAIEQKPATNSGWAASAREGKRIVEFRCEGCYVAKVCEGNFLWYQA